MASTDYTRNVAIVGAGGNSGSYMTAELLKTGKHSITAVTRIDSQSKFPKGVQVARVDYNKPETIVEALKGQDALVITLSSFADPSQQNTLIKAAGEAGAPWILSNEWAPDSAHPGLAKDVPVFDRLVETKRFITEHGKSAFVAVSCGFWYEWSLSIPTAYGIDLIKKEVGRAVAAILSLPIKSGGSNTCLEHYRNKHIYVNSFTVSQEDMFRSALRVTGTDESEWKVSYEQSRERHESGLQAMRQGNQEGFVKAMYTRVFYPDGSGDYGTSRGLSNEVMGLPKEDLDDATRAALERARATTWGGTAERNLK